MSLEGPRRGACQWMRCSCLNIHWPEHSERQVKRKQRPEEAAGASKVKRMRCHALAMCYHVFTP